LVEHLVDLKVAMKAGMMVDNLAELTVANWAASLAAQKAE
jgi:hypothetical protein